MKQKNQTQMLAVVVLFVMSAVTPCSFFLSLVVAKNRQIGGVFTFSWDSRSKKHRKYGCFLHLRSPKPRYLRCFFASGSTNHCNYLFFWTAPSKNTHIHAVFGMLQELVFHAKGTKTLYIRVFWICFKGSLRGCRTLKGRVRGIENEQKSPE